MTPIDINELWESLNFTSENVAEFNQMLMPNATAIACGCDSTTKLVTECGPFCPTVLEEIYDSNKLNETIKQCPGIDAIITATISDGPVTPNSGIRMAIGAVIVLAFLWI
jgi:hypothetical protein